MLSRHCSLQKGFSLIRFIFLLLALLGFAILVLALLPRLSGGNIDILNSLSQRAQRMMSGVTQKVSAIGQSLAAPIDKIKGRIVRKLEDLEHWWYCYKNPGECPGKVSYSLTREDFDILSSLETPGSYTLTRQSLDKLRKQKIPENILESLQPIIDQKFTTRDDFLNAVEEGIGPTQKALKIGPTQEGLWTLLLNTGSYADISAPQKTIRPVILESLKPLENQKFASEKAFWAAVEKLLGSSGLTATDTEKDKILARSRRGIQPDPWVQDMQDLINYARANGYNMQEVIRLLDKYLAGETGQKQVEAEYFDQLQQQTAAAIDKNIERFRKRPLGCSDFTVELTNIYNIEQLYNVGMPWEYVAAKYLSSQLHDPRSEDFFREIFGFLGYQNYKWFTDRFGRAKLNNNPPPDYQPPDYSSIIEEIDARMQNASNPFECILGNITVAEIYLNYDLIDPAQNRYDLAIRDLADLFTRYGNSMPLDKQAGLHMALGLLNERVCRNNDLAIKEFKDAIAAARRMNLNCRDYNLAHYQLGVINLKLRDTKQVQIVYQTVASAEATPTPAPTPAPTPTPRPSSIKIPINIDTVVTIGIPTYFKTARQADTVTSRGIPGATKGEITTQRDIRELQSHLKPRSELGPTQKMKTFSIDQLYDLSRIPDSAVRVFEAYLQCPLPEEKLRIAVARYIHDRYMGK